MKFLALDLGTTFIKGAVIDLDTLGISQIQRIAFPDPIPHLPPLFCEVDPRAILTATRALITALAPYAPDCAGIVMCGQMQGLVLTDEQGQPYSNYISWRDQRALTPHPVGGTYFDAIQQRITPAERRQMGSELRASLPVGTLFWLAEQNQLRAGSIPASLSDFVIANLGVTMPTIEPTNASVHGLLNLETLAWHDAVIAKLGLNCLRFPALQRTGEIVGWIELNGTRVPCYTPVGDQPCALVGALLQDHELAINISTGSQVALLSPRLVFGDYQTRPFFDNQFLNIITHIPAGRSLTALIHLLTEISCAEKIETESWDYIIRAVESVGETNLRVNLAFFAGACGDQGAIENICEDNLTIGHLFRSAFENMADNYWACAQRLSPERAWNRIVFSGGLAQKIERLRQLICARLASDYRIAPSAEDTLLGLLALALTFSGRATSVAGAMEIIKRDPQNRDHVSEFTPTRFTV